MKRRDMLRALLAIPVVAPTVIKSIAAGTLHVEPSLGPHNLFKPPIGSWVMDDRIYYPKTPDECLPINMFETADSVGINPEQFSLVFKDRYFRPSENFIKLWTTRETDYLKRLSDDNDEHDQGS